MDWINLIHNNERAGKPFSGSETVRPTGILDLHFSIIIIMIMMMMIIIIMIINCIIIIMIIIIIIIIIIITIDKIRVML